MKFSVILKVDEQHIRNVTGENEQSLQDIVESEMGWLNESGITPKRVLQLPNEDNEEEQKLIDDCIHQIEKDINEGDTTALEELLKHIPVEFVKSFLPE
jgi:hypothetical protein